MRVDFNYLMNRISDGKVKRPWRHMSKRQFKKHAPCNLDYDEIFILATNAKVGDVYNEHEENHRICEIKTDDRPWDQVWLDSVSCRRFSKKGRMKMSGYIINEKGVSTCGYSHLWLPVSYGVAAEMELMNCLAYFDTDRLRNLLKKHGWYRSESKLLETYSWCADARDDPGFALYVDWAKRVVRIYDEDGPLTIVDEDGVLLESHQETRKDIWKMCWSTKEGKG